MQDLRREKDRVLALSSKLLAREGLDGLTLEKVAETAKVDRPTLSRLFFSREELVFQLLQREVKLLIEEAQEGLAKHSEVSALIRQLSADSVAFAERRPVLRALMLGRFDQRMPLWAERLSELRMQCVALPELLLKTGVEAGLLRADLPVEAAARLLLDLHVMDYANLSQNRQLQARSQLRRTVALQLVLRGLRHPSRPADLSLAQVMGLTGAQAPMAPPPAPPPALDPVSQALVRARREGLAALKTLPRPPEFDTQEAYLLSLITRDVEAVVAAVRAVQRPGDAAMLMLKVMSERSYQAVQEHGLVLTLINGEAQESLPEHQEALVEMVQRMADTILPAVQAGVEQQLFRSDLPLDMVARVLFELHMAGHLLHKDQGPAMLLRATQRRFAALELIFRGILAPEKAPVAS